jgi:hypothetical protein
MQALQSYARDNATLQRYNATKGHTRKTQKGGDGSGSKPCGKEFDFSRRLFEM